jgi:[CysO sulfur-carrier protein]-S-L-cysteine hydrolase
LEQIKSKEKNLKRKGRNSGLKDAAVTHKGEVRLPRKLYQQMLTLCMKEMPNEACGLISGKGNQSISVWPMTNTEPSPYSFAIDLKEQEIAMREMKRRNENFIGIYHSHPYGKAWPSRDDVVNVQYQDAYYFIAAIGKKSFDLKCFKLADRKIEPVQIYVV